MFISLNVLLPAALSVTLLFSGTRDSRVQQQPATYPSVVQRLRSAKAKIAADSRDIYPLIQILQGEAT
jgi:hypothetical protein